MALDLVVGSPPKIEKVATGLHTPEGPVFSRHRLSPVHRRPGEPNPAMGGRARSSRSGRTATALTGSHSIIKAGCSLASTTV